MEESANCVVIAGKRGGEVSYAACPVLATTRADVNGVVRRHLGVRKASFGAVEVVTFLTSMEYGGITPIGLPSSWPVLTDERVAKAPSVIIGSGIRDSKLQLAGSLLASLPSNPIRHRPSPRVVIRWRVTRYPARQPSQETFRHEGPPTIRPPTWKHRSSAA